MRIGRRPLQFIVAILGLGAILVVLQKPILRAAGWALVAEDAIEPADIIVVPEWAQDPGALEAADLVRSKVATRVAVLLDQTEPAQIELVRRGILPANNEPWMSQLLKRLGVTTVEGIPNSAEGTQAEGQVLSDWCNLHQFRSIVVVSTPDHSRRVRRVLRRSMKGKTKVMVRATHYSPFDPDRWWETRDGVRTAIVEVEKLVLDLAGHPIS